MLRSLLVAVFCFVAGFGIAELARPKGYNQATAVYLCNSPVGVIVSKPNGDSDFLKFADPKTNVTVDTIQKEHRNLLSLGGAYCEGSKPKVY